MKGRSAYAPLYVPGLKPRGPMATINPQAPRKHVQLPCALEGCPAIIDRRETEVPRSGRVFCCTDHHNRAKRGQSLTSSV